MRILLLNTVACGGSIGAHLRNIALTAGKAGHEVCVAYGRGSAPDYAKRSIRIGSTADSLLHAAYTRFADAHGLASKRATERFIEQAEAFDPHVVHIHNIHGYYLHYPALFEWIKNSPRRFLWTFHDCWPLTGHCAFPDTCACSLHTSSEGCRNCPAVKEYPSSLFFSRAADNFQLKQAAFSNARNITLLPVCKWMDSQLERSFLAAYPRHIVGIDPDTEIFSPDAAVKAVKPYVLGVAKVWDRRKSPDFFLKLRKALPPEVDLVLAGNADIRQKGIICRGNIDSPAEMARLYASAAVFVNPTVADNFPMTNREALCCGTPVVTRNVGGAAENIVADGIPVTAVRTDSELIDATISMLDTTPEQRQRAAQHGRELFAAKPNTDRLMKIYTSAESVL